MATKNLNTRIITKHADLSVWEDSSLILKEGEVVLAKVLVPQPDGTQAPTFVAKVGNNATFASSPWLFAKASDVYGWAKKAQLDVADIPALDISKITGLQAALDNKVETSVFNAKVTELQGAITGANESAVSAAKEYANQLNTAMDGRVKTIEDDYLKAADKTALQGSIDGVAGRATALETSVAGILNEDTGIEAKANAYTDAEVAKANGAAATAQSAAEAAQAAADAAQGDVDTLEGTVNTLSGTVAGNKTAAEQALASEKQAREQADTQIRSDFADADDVVRDEFAAADNALDEKISANTTAIGTEKTQREAADSALDGRITSVENKLKDVTNVMDFQGAVSAKPAVDGYQDGDVIVVTEGDDAGKEFVLSDGAWVELGSTSASDAAIAALQDDMDDVKENKADKTALEGEVSAREAADATLQGNIDTLSGTVTANKNAFDSYKETNDARVKAVEDKNSAQDTTIGGINTRVEAIEGDYLKAADKTALEGKITAEENARKEADTALGGRIDGVVERVGAAEGKIQTLEGKATTAEQNISQNAEDIAAMDAAYKAADQTLTDDLAALAGRVTTAESDIDNLETAVAGKASNDTVNGINTRLQTVELNAIFDGDEVILDCGGAE